MTEKQIIDRLDSINLSLKQKKDLIDVIKNITASSDNDSLDIFLDFTKENITIYGKSNEKNIIEEVRIEAF